METATIILLSVLSTLGVVAIITLVVVSFYKLGRKVDTSENNVFKSLEETREEMYNITAADRDDSSRQLEELRRELDSRCDKLDHKIKSSTAPSTLETNKTVLQG
jgi:biopolymer transport protein ExbB/TolQ